MRVLYLGLEVPDSLKSQKASIIHCPIIKIVPKGVHELKSAFQHLERATHILITSKTAARLFYKACEELGFAKEKVYQKIFLSVGKATSHCLQELGITRCLTAEVETQEGMIELIKRLEPTGCHLFWPHSKRSRNTLLHFLQKEGISHTETHLYDTLPQAPKRAINFDEIDEIFFTSPSCVTAFLLYFGTFPKDKKLIAQGPQTQSFLEEQMVATKQKQAMVEFNTS